MSDQILLRPGEVAKRLALTGPTVSRLAQEGRFPGAFKLTDGGHWRIPESAVEQFINERQAAADRLSGASRRSNG